MRKVLFISILLLACALCMPALAGETCRLASDGKALVPIVVSAKANASVRHTAEELRDMLKRITGAAFTIQTGDGSTGLAVGMVGDFPTLAADKRESVAMHKDGGDLTMRVTLMQSYVLQSHAKGLQVIGASELAVEYGMWDLLYRLGYRQFFPGDIWEVVPHATYLELSVDTLEIPDYYDRRICCMGQTQWWDWFMKNRLTLHGFWGSRKPYLPDMPVKWKKNFVENSHAYSYIVRDYADVFKAHPEWMALSNGERGKSTFLCISQPGLRDFIANYAVSYLEKNPDEWSISLEPTDGNGWCECDQCKAMGKISNRPVLLANTAAEAIDKRFPNEVKLVGMYGYGMHWQPPDLKVNDRVVVTVTTSTLCSGEGNNPPMDERLTGWAKQAKHVGVYDYWALFAWGGWTPGHSPAGNPKYLADVIPHYHDLGARVWLSEADDCWGACGLGYYLSTRLFWDVKDGKRAKAIVDDFLDRAFGPAKEPMRAYFKAIDGSHGSSPGNPNAIRGRVTQMYPALLRARALARDPAMRKRVDQFLLYTRFMELFYQYYYAQERHDLHLQGVTDNDVREVVKTFMRFAYQIRNTDMVNYGYLEQAWFPSYHLTLKELAPAGADVPPELTDADVDAIAADATRRYAVKPVDKEKDYTGFTIRNGDQVLFDAEGFETMPKLAAGTYDSQKNDVPDASPVNTKKAQWTVTKFVSQNIQVTNAPESDSDPGALDGKQYLRLMRGVNGTETNIRANFDPQSKGTVEIEWMAHGDPGGDYDDGMEFSLMGGGHYLASVLTRVCRDVMYLTPKQDYKEIGITYDCLKWEKWKIRYTPGEDHFSLTIGDKTVDNVPVAIPGNVDCFEIRVAMSYAKFYIDGVSTAQPPDKQEIVDKIVDKKDEKKDEKKGKP